MISALIDGHEVAVENGTTIMQAAATVGIEIPGLCYVEGLPAQTTCLLCLVEIDSQTDLRSSCATALADGMVIHTGTPRVIAARKMCLELLFSDHAGSCVGNCTNACPANLEIGSFLDHVEAGDDDAALRVVRRALPLPAVLGRVCAAYCESACLRKNVDEPLSIRRLHGALAETNMASDQVYVPECKPPTGHRVAIVGAGPAGLSAAHYLLIDGHACTVFDANAEPGGLLRYGMPDGMLDPAVLDAELDIIARMGAEFRGSWQLGRDGSVEQLRRDFDAVLLACGAGINWASEQRAVDTEWLRSQALPCGKRGMSADRTNGHTSVPGVFAAGEMVTGMSNSVRSMAFGHRVAEAISGWLVQGDRGHGYRTPLFFRAKMTDGEADAFFDRLPAQRATDTAIDLGLGSGAPGRARGEASRCLGCECVSLHDCKLRAYAARYNADPNRFRGSTRRELAPDRSHPLVDYEPGKCILCGLCIAVAEAAGDPGLAFTGRGFSTVVGTPFGDTIRDGIRRSARRCAEVCPSGAITLKPQPALAPPGEDHG